LHRPISRNDLQLTATASNFCYPFAALKVLSTTICTMPKLYRDLPISNCATKVIENVTN